MDDLENAVNDWAVHIELLGQVGGRPAKGSKCFLEPQTSSCVQSACESPNALICVLQQTVSRLSVNAKECIVRRSKGEETCVSRTLRSCTMSASLVMWLPTLKDSAYYAVRQCCKLYCAPSQNGASAHMPVRDSQAGENTLCQSSSAQLPVWGLTC